MLSIVEQTTRVYEMLETLNFNFAKAIFYALERNRDLNGYLAMADFRARRRIINRHDKRHAITVISHAIEIFNILRSSGKLHRIHFQLTDLEVVHAFNTAERITLEEHIMIAIIISSFCHDIGRLSEEDHATKSWSLSRESVESILKNYYEEEQFPKIGRTLMQTLIQECVEKHEAEKPQEYGEQGVVTIADIIDNDKTRIQPDETTGIALTKDPRPIEYFGCKDIQSISLEPGSRRLIHIEYHITGYAAIHHITSAIQKIQNMEKSRLSNNVEIIVILPDGRSRIRVFP